MKENFRNISTLSVFMVLGALDALIRAWHRPSDGWGTTGMMVLLLGCVADIAYTLKSGKRLISHALWSLVMFAITLHSGIDAAGMRGGEHIVGFFVTVLEGVFAVALAVVAVRWKPVPGVRQS